MNTHCKKCSADLGNPDRPNKSGLCSKCYKWHYKRTPKAKLAGLAYKRRVAGLPAPTRPTPEFCECCGRLPGKTAMNLDHCHRTGAFRGWLCAACNRGLGLLGDTAASVSLAVQYLNRHGVGQ